MNRFMLRIEFMKCPSAFCGGRGRRLGKFALRKVQQMVRVITLHNSNSKKHKCAAALMPYEARVLWCWVKSLEASS